MVNFASRLSLAIAVLAPAALAAQSTPATPAYNVITVYRETVKPGKGAAHDAHESAWARAVAAAKPPTGFLAMTAMSGPPENWYISAYSSWAEYEKANKATDASPELTAIGKQFSAKEDEFLSDARGMVLTFRQDLSYGGPADLAASRYFTVTRVSVRPGHAEEYEANRKMIKAAHESGKLADGYSMWQAAGGAPGGTYYTFAPRKSLSELDENAAVHGAAYQAALGGPEGQKKMAANTAAAVISSQTDLFAFAPQQSIPPAAWVAADPGYWKYKTAPKKKP